MISNIKKKGYHEWKQHKLNFSVVYWLISITSIKIFHEWFSTKEYNVPYLLILGFIRSSPLQNSYSQTNWMLIVLLR